MAKYRNKPRVIDTFQWFNTTKLEDTPDWFRQAYDAGLVEFNYDNTIAIIYADSSVIEAEVYRLGLEGGFSYYCAWDCRALWKSSICDECDKLKRCERVHLCRLPYINTLEGELYISSGDYIITGVKGERYPCKPDIFHMTYEKVEE